MHTVFCSKVIMNIIDSSRDGNSDFNFEVLTTSYRKLQNFVPSINVDLVVMEVCEREISFFWVFFFSFC